MNWETHSTRRSPSGSLSLPEPSSKTRNASTFAAILSASRSPSPAATPSRTSRPGPIAATRSPSTDTEAELTRWTRARKRLASVAAG